MEITNEILIRQLVENWARSVRDRDINGILAHHSTDIVMFDVPEPFQSVGIDAYRKTWDIFFKYTEPGIFEKNDSFFLIFAIPSWLCIMLGMIYKIDWVTAIGLGILLYGIAYFFIHEVIIHQRVKWFTRSNNIYIRTIRWAHKMHHKHLNKYDGESFGMLFVAKKYWDKVRNDKKMINLKS